MADDDPLVLEDEPATLSSDDVAGLLDCSPSLVVKLVHEGKLEADRTPRGAYLFRRQEVDRLRQERAGRPWRRRASFWDLP